MLESYFQEIKRRKRRKLFFWILVFVFATLLYFFFKGKYISINLNWNNILSQSGNIISETEKSVSGTTQTGSFAKNLITFNSFWIVNVKVFPRDSQIYLNHEPYSNDSKPRIDYGDYLLEIFHDGYIAAEMNFSITEEKNFYIDDISLLKTPKYSLFPKIQDGRIVSIGDNSWIGYSSSGMLLYQKNFEKPTRISKVNYDHIGGGKFLSGGTLIEYSQIDEKWLPNTNLAVKKFLNNCPNPNYQNGLIHCEENQSAITEAGNIFTGVLMHGKNFLKGEKNIIVGDLKSGNTKSFALTGASLEGTNFFEISGDWYTNSGATFVSIDSMNPKILDFDLDFEKIDFVQQMGRELAIIGTKNDAKKLVLIDTHAQKHGQYLKIPENVELENIRIYEKERNFFLKTRNSLLFFYRESEKLEWIVDGKILAIGDTFALYEKEGGIWMADWRDPLKNPQ